MLPHCYTEELTGFSSSDKLVNEVQSSNYVTMASLAAISNHQMLQILLQASLKATCKL